VIDRDGALYPFEDPWEDSEEGTLHLPLVFLAIYIAHDDVFAPLSSLEVTGETSIVLHLAS
jgi:hypothetical protein